MSDLPRVDVLVNDAMLQNPLGLELIAFMHSRGLTIDDGPIFRRDYRLKYQPKVVVAQRETKFFYIEGRRAPNTPYDLAWMFSTPVIAIYNSTEGVYLYSPAIEKVEEMQLQLPPDKAFIVGVTEVVTSLLNEVFRVTVEPPNNLVDIRDHWVEIADHIRRDASILHSLSPRQFEEFTASLLEREGFEVELTPAQKDGGVDILAYQRSPLGPLLFAVECKKYSPERPVGVDIVRQVLGATDRMDVNACAVFTTSNFTRGAIRKAEERPRFMHLHDLKKIEQWVREIKELKGES